MRYVVIRKTAGWMAPADERILEYLDTSGPASPKQISDDSRIRFGRVHAQNRVKSLKDAGFIRLIGNGIYEITDDGRDFLDGKIDAMDYSPDT